MRLLSLLFLSFSLMTFAVDGPPAPVPASDYTAEDIALTAEGLPSTFVNHVNTVFGNFLLPTVDFIVPGPTPMPMVRYYNSDSSTSTWLHGVGMSSNHPLWIRGACPSETVFHLTIPKISFPLQLEPPHRWPTPEDDLEIDDGPEAEALCELYEREHEKVAPAPIEDDTADFLEERDLPVDDTEDFEKGLSHREERERRREAEAARKANERELVSV